MPGLHAVSNHNSAEYMSSSLVEKFANSSTRQSSGQQYHMRLCSTMHDALSVFSTRHSPRQKQLRVVTSQHLSERSPTCWMGWTQSGLHCWGAGTCSRCWQQPLLQRPGWHVHCCWGLRCCCCATWPSHRSGPHLCLTRSRWSETDLLRTHITGRSAARDGGEPRMERHRA